MTQDLSAAFGWHYLLFSSECCIHSSFVRWSLDHLHAEKTTSVFRSCRECKLCFRNSKCKPPLLPLTSVKGHFLHPCPNDKKVSYELVMGSLTRPSLITGVGTQIAAPTNLLARDPTILTRQQLIWLLFRPGRPHRRAFVRSVGRFMQMSSYSQNPPSHLITAPNNGVVCTNVNLLHYGCGQ